MLCNKSSTAGAYGGVVREPLFNPKQVKGKFFTLQNRIPKELQLPEYRQYASRSSGKMVDMPNRTVWGLVENSFRFMAERSGFKAELFDLLIYQTKTGERDLSGVDFSNEWPLTSKMKDKTAKD